MPEGDDTFGELVEATDQAQGHTRREGDRANMPGVVHSDSSSPNPGDLAVEGLPLSPADRKRNKLGYHRTAVACGHCRRRKIRCVPAFEDSGGRCQNCIRLKKDCHFFPVDQPTSATGTRVRSMTKTAENPINEGDTSVASSSPGGVFRSASMEQMNPPDGISNTPPLPTDSPGYPGLRPPRSVSVQGLDFPHSYDAGQHQQLFNQSSYSPRSYAPDTMNPQIYQQQYGQSLPIQYSSAFTTGSYPATMATMGPDQIYGYQTQVSNGGYNWGAPTRSISSDASEDISSGFPTPFRTNTYPFSDRSMAAQMQQVPVTSSAMVSLGMEGQQASTHHTFGDSTSQQSMQMRMRPEWRGGGPDPAQIGSYAQAWYQPTMAEASQDDGQMPVLPSQGHKPYQRKPG